MHRGDVKRDSRPRTRYCDPNANELHESVAFNSLCDLAVNGVISRLSNHPSHLRGNLALSQGRQARFRSASEATASAAGESGYEDRLEAY
jgi:hypothetical protein